VPRKRRLLDNNFTARYNYLMQVVPMKEGNTKEIFSSVSPKGQVTIPAEIRHMLGVGPRDKVAFRVENGQVLIRPARSTLDAAYRSIPALARPLSDKEMTEIVHEEHAQEAAEEGRG
jgi:AbrB family looped-hinge helix DNA binding protein